MEHIGDPLFVAGTMLHWAEGAKTAPRFAVTNTDAAVLLLFIRWARHFHTPDPQFVLSLHLHDGNDENAARRWWAEALSLETADFTKSFTKPSGTRHRKNPFGAGRMPRMREVQHRCPWP